MVDDQEKSMTDEELAFQFSKDGTEIADVIIGVRNHLLRGGFSQEGAEAGALQYQHFIVQTGINAHAASLRPKGLFG